MPHFFSHSKKETYERCPQEYRHKYIRKIYPRKRPPYFVVGSAVHAFLDRFYDTRGEDIPLAVRAADQVFEEVDQGPLTPDEIHNLNVDRAMVQGICEAYPKFYQDDFAEFPLMLQEQNCLKKNGMRLMDYEGEDVFYEGVIDALWKDGGGQWWILETKVLQDVSQTYLDRTHIESQTLGYMWLAKKIIGEFPTGILYNFIKKPKIRLKKGETKSAFKMRVTYEYTAYGSSKNYFIRHPIEVSKSHLERWLEETKHTLGMILTRSRVRSPMWPKFTSSCMRMYGSPCPYLPACKDGKYNRLIYKKELSNEEKKKEKNDKKRLKKMAEKK